MKAGAIAGRLLWREWREGRPPVGAAVSVTFLAFPLAATYGKDRWLGALFMVAGAIGAHLVIAFWAAEKGDATRHGAEFARTHLPVHPAVHWAFTLLFPMAASAGVGAWFGLWSVQVSRADALPAVWAGALDMATTYALAYFLAAALSYWGAIFIAVVRTIAGTSISVWDLQPFRDPDVVALAVQLAVGAVLASFVFSALSQKKSRPARQAVSFALLAAVIVAPSIGRLNLGSVTTRNGSYQNMVAEHLESRDRAVSVDASLDQPRAKVKVCYIDRRTGLNRERSFEQAAQIVDFTEGGLVYLAQQRPGAKSIAILRWNARSGSVRQVAAFPVSRELLQASPRQLGAVSPDGRYIILTLKSLYAQGPDVWLVDVSNNKSRVLLMGRSYWGEVRVAWRDRLAVMSLPNSLVRVDLGAMRAHSIELSIGGGN